MPSRLKISVIFFAFFFFISCAGYHVKPSQPKGVYHRVKSGDTLWRIARAYNISLQELAEANNIMDPKIIEAGSVLFIPYANQVIDDISMAAGKSEEVAKSSKEEKQKIPEKKPKEDAKIEATAPKKDEQPAKEPIKDEKKLTQAKSLDIDKKAPSSKKEEPKIYVESKDKSDAGRVSEKPAVSQKIEQKPHKSVPRGDTGEEENLKFDKSRFIWPVKGKVISKFGIQPNGMYFNGIKIAAKEGTPVLAAAGGVVIFSAPLRDYGETIIIKHEYDYATVYTNIANRLVKVDDIIRKGREIAYLADHDKKGNAFFNFEIRLKNKARNPLFYLP